MNIALCGFMGAGKTSVGRELSKITGRRFVDTDELAEKEENTTVSRIFSDKGEAYFRDLEYEICKKTAHMNNTVISTGGGAMTYERNVKAIKRAARVVFIDTPFDVICKRVGDASGRPLFKNWENAKNLFEERRSKYLAAADFVVNGDQSVKKIAAEIAELVK